MSFFFEQPRLPRGLTFAGGEATMAEIAGAAIDSQRYANSINSGEQALVKAYDRRIEAVRKATGVTLEHPERRADAEWKRLETERPVNALNFDPGQTTASERRKAIFQRERSAFTQRLAELAQQYPAARDAIRPQTSIEADAASLAVEAERRSAMLSDSRDGLAKWSAVIAGAGAGSLYDPTFVPSMFLGGGAGAGRTVAARILSVATREALINGGVEAALQPAVQAWRGKIGLPSGFDEGLRNVAMAAAVGGLLGGAIGGAGEAIGAIGRRGAPARDALAAQVARAPDTGAEVRSALAGDMAAQRKMLEPIRDALPAEARGALDEADRVEMIDAARPAEMRPDRHEAATVAAGRALAGDEPGLLTFPIDDDQVARIVDRLAPPDSAATVPTATRLSSFLMRAGGLKDETGDVASIAGGQVAERFTGSLIKDDGLALDRAREMAAEAGYLDRLYGSPEEAMARSTPRDLLDLLDEDLRGSQILPGLDAAERARDIDAERGHLDGLAREVARYAGPGISDDLIVKAMRAVQDEGLHPADAVERMLTYEVAETAEDGTARVIVGDDGEPIPSLPGWSDEEITAAMAPRGPEPRADGLDDPAMIVDEDLIGERDIAGLEDYPFVDDEGNVMLMRDWLTAIADDENAARVVEACRI